jgi:hypothetical protein
MASMASARQWSGVAMMTATSSREDLAVVAS